MDFILPLLITLPASALSIIGISLMLSVVVVALAYMFAYAIQSPQMVALAKEELAALFFSVILIIFWISFDTVVNSITFGLLEATLPPQFQGYLTVGADINGLTTSHLNLALASLDIFVTKLKDIYIDLYLFEALIGFLSTISFPLGSPLPAVNIISFSLAPFVGLTLLSNAHTVVVEAVGYLFTLIWGKEFIIIFARDAVPLFLLPLGLVMRALPFLRRTGSSLIALSFVMYFVFPFSVILSNYLIFDIFKPADFAYNPASTSFFGTERDQEDVSDDLGEGRDTENGPASHILDQFESNGVISESQQDEDSECYGNSITQMVCSVKYYGALVVNAGVGFVQTVFGIWKFMMGMTGDFFYTAFNNPLMPASASAGLYHFIIKEIAAVSPFIILVILTTVIEIVISVTMYRNVAILIGGEAEIVGLTKIV